MKKLNMSIILLLLLGWLDVDCAVAQWQTSGSSIYYNEGGVAIGTAWDTAFMRTLTIEGGIELFGEGSTDVGYFAYRPIENNLSVTRWFLRADLSNNQSFPYLTNRTPHGKVAIKTGSASGGSENTHFTIEGGDGIINAYFENSRVGIGTTNPVDPLTIKQDNGGAANLSISSNSSLISLGESQAGPHGISFGDEEGKGVQLLYRTSPNRLTVEKANDFSAGVNLFFIDYDTEQAYFKGKLGVGTENPAAELAVNGTTKTKEIIVTDQSGAWPDYVFEGTVDGRPETADLGELEAYIRTNKHLPGIPTANEINKDGQNLGAIQAKLLEKIEELTLHVIELKKENEKQQMEILELKQHKH